MVMKVLEIKNLRKSYQNELVIKDISLILKEQEVKVLIGEIGRAHV